MNIYAFKNMQCRNSSSGGAFPSIILAIKEIEKCNPIVYGAAFDDKYNVVHVRTANCDEYKQLYGSKYVKSELNNTFSQVQEDLMNGHVVLFSGTPCQVMAIKKYIKLNEVDDSKLYLVDIVCHGTPKNEYWKEFKNWIELEENSKIVDFSFRYQKARWKSYPIMAKFENGKTKVNTFKLRRYVELFYSDLMLMEVCYKCPFVGVNRISDVTIGDFWGIRNMKPKFPFDEEVSQLLINSEKGNIILKMLCSDNENFIQEYNLNDAIAYQQVFNESTKKPLRYDEFNIDKSILPFHQLLKKYAGYNVKGFIKHSFKRFLGETGILRFIKQIMKK